MVAPITPPRIDSLRPEPAAATYILRVRPAGRALVFEVIDLRSGERHRLAGVRALSRWLASRPGGLR
jgi:nucleoside-triphosphatase THEP1